MFCIKWFNLSAWSTPSALCMHHTNKFALIILLLVSLYQLQELLRIDWWAYAPSFPCWIFTNVPQSGFPATGLAGKRTQMSHTVWHFAGGVPSWSVLHVFLMPSVASLASKSFSFSTNHKDFLRLVESVEVSWELFWDFGMVQKRKRFLLYLSDTFKIGA